MTTFGRLAALFIVSSIGAMAYNHHHKVELIDISHIKPIHEIIMVDPADFLVKIDEHEYNCLRLNVYHEAGNQSVEGKEAVAAVTLNRMRVKHYPSTVCGVVYQRKQFSWTWTLANHAPKLHNVLEKRQWEISGQVAERALRGELSVDIGNATHYHATYVNPKWSRSKRMKQVAKIGTHLFYLDTKAKFS